MGLQGELRPGFKRQATREVAEPDRVDFWRSLHCSVDLDPPRGDDYRAFEAERLHGRSRTGSAVSYSQSDDLLGHFPGTYPEFLVLSLPIAGASEFRSSRGMEIIARPGMGFLVVDNGSIIRSRSHDFAHVFLTLPKRLLELDPATMIGEHGIRILPETGLLRFLRVQLQTIAASGNDLSPNSGQVVLENTVELAVTALDEHRERRAITPEERDLFEAAKTMIEVCVEDTGLTASSIANALGCSRAQLYRAFSDRNCGVGQMIRKTRLVRAKSLLAAHDQLPIKVIAKMSGYESATSFSRAFQRHAGVSPDNYRTARR